MSRPIIVRELTGSRTVCEGFKGTLAARIDRMVLDALCRSTGAAKHQAATRGQRLVRLQHNKQLAASVDRRSVDTRLNPLGVISELWPEDTELELEITMSR